MTKHTAVRTIVGAGLLASRTAGGSAGIFNYHADVPSYNTTTSLKHYSNYEDHYP